MTEPPSTPQHHLILGGCGFIGRHVALLLAMQGHRVTVADRTRLPFPVPPDLADRITWRSFELASPDWDALIADTAVVHHYAWSSLPASANSNPTGDLIANVVATLGLLDALRRRGEGRLVFASSGGTVYGKLSTIPVPEDHPIAPVTAYGSGKAAAEIYLGLHRAMHGTDCRIARIANPYGAGQDLTRGQGAVTTFLHRALTGQVITIWGDGEVVRDYLHIADVAHALVTLATTPPIEPFIFNIGSGLGSSLNDIVHALETRLGRTVAVNRTETRPFDVPVSILAIDRARRYLGWQPTISLAEGLDRTIADLIAARSFSTLVPDRA
jgi:UDP-glucose 4-epimerase